MIKLLFYFFFFFSCAGNADVRPFNCGVGVHADDDNIGTGTSVASDAMPSV